MRASQVNRYLRKTKRLLAIVLVLSIFLQPGCRTATQSSDFVDTKLVRFAKAGGNAYAEGDIDEAVEEYRQALYRAWAMDDPYESGTAAYHLAACMTSLGDNAKALDWLLDARVELCRAGSSTGNVWLLEAKIAQQECRFEDALCYADRAECTSPPCEQEGNDCLCGPRDPCKECCVTSLPCVGSKLRDKNLAKQCEKNYEAQIHLARATIAAEVYDLPCAVAHYSKAKELSSKVCSDALSAELQHTAAMIHLAKGEHLQAAWHFDREAKYLRYSTTYREIPGTLQLAAASYEQSGWYAQAASRLCRVARIWFARGEIKKSWQYVQQAVELAEIAGSETAQVRLALLAEQIERVVSEDEDLSFEENQQEMILSP